MILQADHCTVASSHTMKLYMFGYYGSNWTDDPGTNIWSYGAKNTFVLILYN